MKISKVTSVFTIILLISTLFMITSFSFVQTVKAADSGWWHDTNWDYCKKITFNADAYISSGLTNFPMLVHIVDDGDMYNHMGDTSDGDELLFTMNGDNETKLNHEIEYWNADPFNGVDAEIWVNVTSVSSSVDTVIWMYYGNASASNQENVAGTWNSDFVAVYHMNDSTTSTIIDSAGSNDGTKLSANNPLQTASGKIGYAQDFDNDYINCGDMSGTENIAHMTILFWNYLQASPSTTYDALMGKQSSPTSRYGWLIYDNGGSANNRILATLGNGANGYVYKNDAYADTTWEHNVFLYDGTEVADTDELEIYIDSVDIGFTGGTSVPNTTPTNVASFYWGWNGADDKANTKIDEAWIMDVTCSENWIKTAYHSQTLTAGFLTFGSEQEYSSAWSNSNPVNTIWQYTNGATDVPLTPVLKINVSDQDMSNQSINVTWQYNDSGSWYTFGYNESTVNVTGLQQTLSNASAGITEYEWRVLTHDNHTTQGWDNDTQSFTTISGAPTQTAQKIWNSTTSTEQSLNATGVSLTPTCFNVTIADPNGHYMNVTIMTNESGSWTEVNSTTSGMTNGTYHGYNTSWVDSYSTTYWISFNVSDDSEWCNETYHFATETNVTETPGIVACILEFDAPASTDSIKIYYGKHSGITTGDNATYTDPEDCNKVNRVARKMIIQGLDNDSTYYYRLYNTDSSSWIGSEGSFATAKRFNATTGYQDKFFDTFQIGSSSNVDIVQQVGVKDSNNPIFSDGRDSPSGGYYGWVGEVTNIYGGWDGWFRNRTDGTKGHYYTSSDGLTWTKHNELQDSGLMQPPLNNTITGHWLKVEHIAFGSEKIWTSDGIINSSYTQGTTLSASDYDGNEMDGQTRILDSLRCNVIALTGQIYVGTNPYRECGQTIGFSETDWLYRDRAYKFDLDEPSGESGNQDYSIRYYIDNGIYAGTMCYWHDDDILRVYLVSSRDGINWTMVNDSVPIIPIGAGGTWDDGMMMDSSYGDMVVGDNKYLYYDSYDGGHGDTHRQCGLGRIKFRKGGLTAVEPSTSSAWFVTDTIESQFVGNFTINGNFTSTNKLNISVLYASNDTVMSGFSHSDFTTITTNNTSITPSWSSSHLNNIPDENFKLNFSFDGANSQLFSYNMTEGAHLANIVSTQSTHKVLDSGTNHTLNATDVLVPPTSFWVTINDADGDKMNITIMENSSGWKIVNQTTGDGLSNGTYSFTNVSWITDYNTKYYITFNVTDGTDWCNETYHFTTTGYVPTITNPYPTNGSIDIPLKPTLNITINDADGNKMNITWYSNSSGQWLLFGTGGLYTTVNYSYNFEEASDLDNWTTTGMRYNHAPYAHSDPYSLEIEGVSEYAYHNLSLANYSVVNISWWNMPVSIETNEYLYLRFYNGTGWSTIRTINGWESGIEDVYTHYYDELNTNTYAFNDNCRICWNVSGSGTSDRYYLDDIDITYGYLNNLPNGTYCWNNSNFSDYDTTYWWNVSVNDGTSTNNSGVFHFTTVLDTTPPSMTINYVGNLSDSDGPYWRPPGETDILDEAGEGVWRNGYYTNASKQHEDWIYLNLTVSDETAVSNVWLQWLNETTWTNYTYAFVNTAGNYWEYNTSGNIQTCEGYNYSFNIVANDSLGNSNMTWWNKTGVGGSYTRRYVQLNCSQYNLSYLPMYLYDTSYTSGENWGKDRFNHDQGPDGATTDTGFLLFTTPTDTVQNRWCTKYVGWWFEESNCTENFMIDNIYYHIWMSQDGDIDNTYIGWNKTRDYLSLSATDYNVFVESENHSSLYYDGGSSYDTYYLMSDLLDITNTQVTDNNIYEIAFKVTTGALNSYPSVINNRSFTSFVLFNVPDNATLNASYADSDSDSLSDWTELYVTYTNPFLSDTDNDGVSDYYENLSGSDPNNYSDTIRVFSLTNPSCEPASGVASYDTFYFNVTWTDNSGKDPTDGYLNVSINRTGWSTNQSLTYVSGDNLSGAIYTYSTTLSAGSYNYTFYGYNSIVYNTSGPHINPTVDSQSFSFTVVTSSADAYIHFNDWTLTLTGVGHTTEYNVSEDNQTGSVPAFNISNTGNVPLNFSMNWTGDPGSGIYMKWNTTDNAPTHGVNTIAEHPASTQIITNLINGSYEHIWLWMDFVSVTAQTAQQDVKLWSELYT